MSSLQTPVQSTMTTDGTSWKNLNKEIPYFFASLLAMFWSLSPSARRPGPRSRIFSSTIIHCYKSSRSRPSSPPHLAFSHRRLLTQAATNLPRRSRVTQLPDTYLHPSLIRNILVNIFSIWLLHLPVPSASAAAAVSGQARRKFCNLNARPPRLTQCWRRAARAKAREPHPSQCPSVATSACRPATARRCGSKGTGYLAQATCRAALATVTSRAEIRPLIPNHSRQRCRVHARPAAAARPQAAQAARRACISRWLLCNGSQGDRYRLLRLGHHDRDNGVCKSRS